MQWPGGHFVMYCTSAFVFHNSSHLKIHVFSFSPDLGMRNPGTNLLGSSNLRYVGGCGGKHMGREFSRGLSAMWAQFSTMGASICGSSKNLWLIFDSGIEKIFFFF